MIRRLVFRALTDAVRNTDIVAHLTDTRFAVLLVNTDQHGAQIAADRVRERLPVPNITVRMASFPHDGRDVASLLRTVGASPELTSAITRGAGGTRTSIMQSDWALESKNTPSDGSVSGADEPVVELQEETPSNVVEFPSARTCDEVGCDLPHHADGLCARHYAAQKRDVA